MFQRLLVGIISVFILGSLAHAAPLAYIANQNSNTVSVIKTGTNAVMTSIPVGNKPYGVAVHPTGTKVYVTNQDSNTVSVIDATANTVSATITLPALAKPAGLAVNPAGTKLYVLNQDLDSISVINTTTNAILTNIPVSAKPSKIAINPAGTRAYVIYEALDQVTVIDTTADSVVTNITTAVNDVPLGVTVDNTGATAYISYLLGGIATINTTTNALSAPIDVATPLSKTSFGYNNIVISPDNTKAYVVSIITNEIFVVNTATNTPTTFFTLPAGNYEFNGMAITPSGSHLAVTNTTNNEVYLVNTATGATTATIAVGQTPQSIGKFIGPDKAVGALITATPPSPRPVGTAQVTVSAEAIGGGATNSYEYKFWLKTPTAAWTVVQNYSTTPSWTWNTSALPAGTYFVQVDIRNVGSTVTRDAAKVLTYVLAPPASAANLVANPTSPRPVGTLVNFTGSGSGGGGNYEYRFWLKPPGGAWSVVRNYSNVATWSWNTTALPIGTYYIQVDVRNTGSTANREAAKVIPFTLYTPATGADLTATPQSPQPAGTANVNFTASVPGGTGTYEYKFWLKTGTTWAVVRNYSTSNVWSWNSTAVPAGTYYIQVDVRGVGSPSTREAAKAIPFVLQ